MERHTNKISISKGSKIILTIFLIFWALDFITTYINLRYIPYLESNPLYIISKSMVPVMIVNIFIIWALMWLYNRRNGLDFSKKFFIINIVVWSALARILAVIANIKVYIAQPSMEVVQAVTTSVKSSHYASLVLFYMYLPLIITQIIYWLFLIDHKIILKKK